MRSQKPNAYSVVGYAGMVVLFASLLGYGDDRPPTWLLLPALVVMVVLTPVGWYVDWRRARRKAAHRNR